MAALSDEFELGEIILILLLVGVGIYAIFYGLSSLWGGLSSIFSGVGVAIDTTLTKIAAPGVTYSDCTIVPCTGKTVKQLRDEGMNQACICVQLGQGVPPAM